MEEQRYFSLLKQFHIEKQIKSTVALLEDLPAKQKKYSVHVLDNLRFWFGIRATLKSTGTIWDSW